MRLLHYGFGIQDSGWILNDKGPCGFIRINYILDEGATLLINGIETPLKKDIIYMFPSKQPYILKCQPGKRFRCFYLDVKTFTHFLDELVCIEHIAKNTMYFQIFALLKTLIKESIDSDDVVAHCSELFITKAYHDNFIQKISSEFSLIIRELASLSTTDVNIQHFAASHHYSVEHFIRLFKEQINISPYQFVLNCRMERAKELLHSDMKITDIALAVGYSDIKAFNRSFKKHLSMSPSEYKKNSVFFI